MEEMTHSRSTGADGAEGDPRAHGVNDDGFETTMGSTLHWMR